MTQTTAQTTFASQTIAVEHVKISSERSFTEVRRKLEECGVLDHPRERLEADAGP